MTNQSIELIQQWQYTGPVNPKLLEDKAFDYVKIAGLTSLQSYVYWEEIEKEPDKIDFSSYDQLIEKIIRHELKWVPFLIAGPSYATPEWFKNSDKSIYARCAEHDTDSKIQSIWNPYLPEYIDRFIKIFAEHYNDHNLFESILLGISGNWGESVYPATGGFGTDFHTHSDWWCQDRFAREDFKRYLCNQYKDIKTINEVYNTSFDNFDAISFPELMEENISNIKTTVKKIIPDKIRRLLMPLYLNFLANRARFDKYLYRPMHVQIRWLDFVHWYTGAMTKWAEFWLTTARKYFPNNEIYLVTGGCGDPQGGADFSSQTKLAHQYRAGIRITNQRDDYAESFIYARLTSSASRFYDGYFTTEEEKINKPHGITMRIFDAATSGAKGIYFKNIIGIGVDACTGETFTIGEPTHGAYNLKENLRYYEQDIPIIETAVLYPNTTINLLRSSYQSHFYTQCSRLRSYLDIDFIDENMIADGALSKYRFLIAFNDIIVCERTLKKIEDYCCSGGIFIRGQSNYFNTINYQKGIGDTILNAKHTINNMKQGYMLIITKKGKKLFRSIAEAVYNEKRIYPWKGIEKPDYISPGVYITKFQNKILIYDSKKAQIQKRELELH